MLKLLLSLFFISLSSSLFLPFYVSLSCKGSQPIVTTITVAQEGHGNFSTVQAAIDSVPDNNQQWIKIRVKAGTYGEKVTIPPKKGHVILEGDGSHRTFIEWGDHQPVDPVLDGDLVSSWDTATFLSLADVVILKGIGFKNTYRNLSHPENAVAALINGDKTSVYNCSFLGVQDTLSDLYGRHYFNNCYIEGIVDFIFGYGQSIYENCTIFTVSTSVPVGFVTAQGRERRRDPNGFVFKNCSLRGLAKAYLGRGWRTYSRVLFYDTYMEDVVIPQGWDHWRARHGGKLTTFAEAGCSGPGSNTTCRVKWEKKLSDDDVNKLTNISTFINYDGWLDQQPHGYNYTTTSD